MLGLKPPGTGRFLYVHRIRFAFPIYCSGYKRYFSQLDSYFAQHKRLSKFERQGLFAHDNTLQALFMAYNAANCLGKQGSFDHQMWQSYRKVFGIHVVED